MALNAVVEIAAKVEEQARVHAVLELVGSERVSVVVRVGGAQVELPPSLVEALIAAADSLDAGDSVAIVSQQAEVSPAQAAKLLGVSRQYVDRLIDADVLPCRRVANSAYRRIPVRAVIEHRTTRDRKRRAIESIVEDAVAAGLAY